MNILVADDHSMIRMGLILLLTNEYPQAKCKEATNQNQACRLVKEQRFDLIFLDINMPNSDISQLIRFCKSQQPQTPLIIISMSDERSFASRFLKMGVDAYIHKSAENAVILEAVSVVLQGKVYMSKELKESLLQSMIRQVADNPFECLSNREFQVVTELLKGKTIAEIASEHGINVSTVSTYKVKAYEKLGVRDHNFMELVSLAKANGLM